MTDISELAHEDETIRIGHPDDGNFPADELTVDEYLEEPRRLHEMASVVTLCHALHVPYGTRYGNWVWVDFSDYEGPPEEIPLSASEVQRLLAGEASEDGGNGIVGFAQSVKDGNEGLAYHKCEDADRVSRQDLAFTDPAEA